jgi:hypothetical protein
MARGDQLGPALWSIGGDDRQASVGHRMLGRLSRIWWAMSTRDAGDGTNPAKSGEVLEMSI